MLVWWNECKRLSVLKSFPCHSFSLLYSPHLSRYNWNILRLKKHKLSRDKLLQNSLFFYSFTGYAITHSYFFVIKKYLWIFLLLFSLAVSCYFYLSLSLYLPFYIFISLQVIFALNVFWIDEMHRDRCSKWSEVIN